jgi:catechol 2,3-dioxygenase-like lactoylglutathione lyase family enzyme
MSLACGDEVPQISTRKSRLRPSEFLTPSAKRLLQHYLPLADIAARVFDVCFRGKSEAAPRVSEGQAGKLNDWNGGRGVYFRDPDGHVFELMTVPQ